MLTHARSNIKDLPPSGWFFFAGRGKRESLHLRTDQANAWQMWCCFDSDAVVSTVGNEIHFVNEYSKGKIDLLNFESFEHVFLVEHGVSMFHCPDEWGLYQFFIKKQTRLFGIGSSICISRNSFLQKSAGLWVLFAWLWLTMASRSPEMSWRMNLRRSRGHKDINEDGTNFKTEVMETYV